MLKDLQSVFKAPFLDFISFESVVLNIKSKKLQQEVFFEFVRGYLLTQQQYQVKKVIFTPFHKELHKKLELSGGEELINVAFFTNQNKLHLCSIQFTEKPTKFPGKLTQKFADEAVCADECCVITNHYEVLYPKGVGALLKPPYQINRQSFERLTEEELLAIHEVINGKKINILKRKPYPHQQAALRKLNSAYKMHDRYTAIMACGTGKTMTALWHAEQSKAEYIVVFVPSLALIAQMLREWLQHTRWKKLIYSVVCSDKKLKYAEDLIAYKTTDIDFPVTTDSRILNNFLKESQKQPKDVTKLIFATYHSSLIIKKALPKGLKIDLGIFDEAHRTANENESAFSLSLSNKNIPFKRRCFFTATPRHYQLLNNKNTDKNKQIMYSMDNEKIYGEKVYTLSFREAIDKELISPYKVLISVVTQDMVKNFLKKYCFRIEKNNSSQEALMIAQNIAIEQAAKKYNLNKIITFHSRIADARKFSALDKYNKSLKIQRYHINSDDGYLKRKKTMDSFKKANAAILTNAKCMSEGVDVPSTDMIAFLSAKKSTIDIVQCVGRAVRKHKGKQFGYILLPLFIDDKFIKDIPQHLNTTKYNYIWEVLNALSEQDQALYDDLIKAKLSDDYEITDVNSQLKKLNKKIEFIMPRDISYLKLETAITVKAVRKIVSGWDYFYEKLSQYYSEYGNTSVTDNLRPLKSWCHAQRKKYRENKLKQWQINKLKKLNFIFENFQDHLWNLSFNKLKKFHEKYGNANVPYNREDMLYRWCCHQMKLYKKDKLDPWKVEKLKSIGFTFKGLMESKWGRNYQKLCEFYKIHGHTKIPCKYYSSLHSWCVDQKKFYREGSLEQFKIKKLKKINFIFDHLYHHNWDKRFSELLDYFNKIGDINVPKQNQCLYDWCKKQRSNYKAGKLADERILKLKNIGFIFDIQEFNWTEKYEILHCFYKKNGHINIQNKSASIHRWIHMQVYLHKKGNLSKHRFDKLKKLNFPFQNNIDSKSVKLDKPEFDIRKKITI